MCKEAHSQSSPRGTQAGTQIYITLLWRRTDQSPRKLSRKHVYPVAKEIGVLKEHRK